jgi:hypothetical protein
MRRITLVALMTFGAACANDFEQAHQVTGVRVLATQSDKPYAAPGESVTLQALAVDARSNASTRMRTLFFPAPCVNPERDDVTKCLARLADAFPVRTNLDAQLLAADSASFTVPADIIETHGPSLGGPPFGVMFTFFIACAGHVERLEKTANYPDQPSFGCFDAGGNLLNSDDYVFAHARTYAYRGLRNENPELEGITFDDVPVEAQGFRFARCTESDERQCKKRYLNAKVADSAQELDPTSGPPGQALREQVWVSYFVTGGKMENDLNVLFDSRTGRLANTRNGIFAKGSSGPKTLYVVLRDSRGGASWKQFPFTID